ncbi:C39 family peptidase [Micromonospora sp. M12]
MVVEYWGRKPSEADTSWVDPTYPDPTVNHAARMTYDYAYDGAGNWPFNTAYAASFPGWRVG